MGPVHLPITQALGKVFLNQKKYLEKLFFLTQTFLDFRLSVFKGNKVQDEHFCLNINF